ncbi:hypothetical protein GCM10009850_013860 [Nonomuraea monospora]|uniref:Leucine-rich repeat domain-containing protein n=1 Tax=Nonomuraea monospora TaxID=568818 RepID=A0ABP5P5R7_9ACTN
MTATDPGLTFLAEPDLYNDDQWAGRTVMPFQPSVESPADHAAWLVQDAAKPRDEGGTLLPGYLDELLDHLDPSRIQALAVTGYGAADAPRVLAEYADRLPALRSVFLGLVTPEQWEISWIRHGDLTPLLEAYPKLERLEVRGSDGLTMRPVTHDHLKVLRFESGGLPGVVVRAVSASTFPALEHLELWLGTEAYYGDNTIGDLDGILSGRGLPALKRLGLRNSEQQNEVAAAVAFAPVVAGLEELSLGLGVLMDEGAEALLSGQPLTHLRVFDLNHHYVSEVMEARLRAALAGVTLDLTRPRHSDGPYLAVSE